MSRILIATDNRFWSTQGGTSARIAAMAAFLARSGHTVGVYFTGGISEAERQRLAAEYGVEPAYGFVPPRPGLFARLGSRAMRFVRPPARGNAPRKPPAAPAPERRLRDFYSPQQAAAFKQVCESFRPDAALVVFIRLAYLAGALPAGETRPRTLIDTIDVMSRRMKGFHERGEKHWINITEDEERDALLPFDGVIAIQPREAETLRAMLPGKTVITALHPAPLCPLPPRKAGPPALGYIASNSAPNLRAIEDFLREVWPALRARHADLRLSIAGGVCDALPETLPEGVEACGFVDHLRDFYEACDIIINPVQFGGGLKIKCVEALCHARPLVTTPTGAEGIGGTAPEPFACCATPDEMRDVLDAWLRDPAARDAVAARGHEYARRRFTPEACFGELSAWIEAASQ